MDAAAPPPPGRIPAPLPPVLPPPLPPAPAPPAPREPAVLRWQRVYLGAMAALYLGVFALGVLLLVLRAEYAGWPMEDDPRTMLVSGVVLAVVGAVFHSAFVAAFLLPRRPWAWTLHLVLIGIGLASCCAMPAAIPLLLHWLKPGTRAWFGRDGGNV